MSAPALAQSKGTLKRAERALTDTNDADRLRASFQELSADLRDQPDTTTAEGWWLRGEMAARLTPLDERPVTMASIALDSFNEALALAPLAPTTDGLAMIEAALTPLAQDQPEIPASDRYAAAEQLLVSGSIRRRIASNGGAAVDEVASTRMKSIAVQAALADRQTRVARKVFLDLEAQGGFIEPLALALAEQLEETLGPQQAFLFLTSLLEEHSHRRRLLIAYVELCTANGWNDEAASGLQGTMPKMKDTYEDHLFLATTYELLHNDPEAESHYKLALRKVPKGFDANLGYARLLGRMAKAGEDSAEQDTKQTAELLAITLRRRAAGALEVALDSNPTHVESLELLVELYTRLDDLPARSATEERLARAGGSSPEPQREP